MGLLWLQAFGEADKTLIEEIAKLHKVDVELVARHYKDLLEAIKDEKE